MKSETKKNMKSRSTKEKISQSDINKLTKLTIGHGKLKAFSDKIGYNYNTVYGARKSKQATPPVKNAILKALKAA